MVSLDICQQYQAIILVIFYQRHIFFCVKMSVFEAKSILLLYFFNMKKSTVESHRLFVETYDEAVLSKTTCHNRFRRFKSEDFDAEGSARRPKLVEDAEWRHYSMKIRVKRKKNLHNHWKLLNQSFPSV